MHGPILYNSKKIKKQKEAHSLLLKGTGDPMNYIKTEHAFRSIYTPNKDYASLVIFENITSEGTRKAFQTRNDEASTSSLYLIGKLTDLESLIILKRDTTGLPAGAAVNAEFNIFQYLSVDLHRERISNSLSQLYDEAKIGYMDLEYNSIKSAQMLAQWHLNPVAKLREDWNSPEGFKLEILNDNFIDLGKLVLCRVGEVVQKNKLYENIRERKIFRSLSE